MQFVPCYTLFISRAFMSQKQKTPEKEKWCSKIQICVQKYKSMCIIKQIIKV